MLITPTMSADGSAQERSVVAASTRLGPAKEHQPELPHPNLVAVGQHSRMDRLPVDVRAVEAAHIDDPEFTSFAADFGMATADGYVVEDDVTVEMAPCCCDRLIQPKSVTGVGSAPNNEHGGAGRHPLKSGHAVFGAGWCRTVAEFGDHGRDSVRDEVMRRLVVASVVHLLFLIDCSGGVVQILVSANLRFVSAAREQPDSWPMAWGSRKLLSKFVMR